MKILFLTQFFYPDIQATSLIFSDLCEDLANEHDVNVICGAPLLTASGKDCGLTGNIKINRVFSTRRTKKTLWDRFVNHITFGISAMIACLRMKRSDVLIFTSDNPFNILPALFLRCKKLYLCQDLYSEQGRSLGIFSADIISSILSFLQNRCFRISDKIVVIGPRMSEYLKEIGVPEEKIDIVGNWADTDRILPCEQNNCFSREHGLDGKFVVMHSGRVGYTQDLEMLLDCAEHFRDYEDMIFLIVGEGVLKSKLEEIVRRASLNNVKFLPYQSRDTLRYSLATASISVILCKSGLSRYLVPSRLFGIMASARPVVASIDKDSRVYDVILDSDCGIAIPPGDLESLKDAILKIYDDPKSIITLGDKGRSYMMTNFSRKVATATYNRIINDLLRN